MHTKNTLEGLDLAENPVCDQASKKWQCGHIYIFENTNLKYSMPHVPDNNYVRFTWEAQQGNSY